MTKFINGLTKAIQILFYHGGSMVIAAILTYLANHATMPSWFGMAFTHFGLPVAAANALWAAIEEVYQTKAPTVPTPPSA